MIKPKFVSIAGSKMKGNYHNTYTPSDEAAICLNGPLPTVRKRIVNGFKKRKEN